jgi:hypothetical protein
MDNKGSIPSIGRDFSIRYRTNIGSEAHPVPYTMNTGLSLRGKGLRREAGRSPIASAEINTPWSFIYSPPHIMARHLGIGTILLFHIIMIWGLVLQNHKIPYVCGECFKCDDSRLSLAQMRRPYID